MKKEFKIDFIENAQEFSDEEMGNILGGFSLANYEAPCGCKCGLNIGTNCGCNKPSLMETYNSCPCDCPTPKS
jgi:natural product precursor